MRRERGKRRSGFGFFSLKNLDERNDYGKIVAGTTIVRAFRTKPQRLKPYHYLGACGMTEVMP
jgi:hypothetical protein